MARFVALLRGINLGRNRRIAMADLRTVMEELGYEDVSTLLASGNVLFSGSKAKARDTIERGLQDRFDMQIDVDALRAQWAARPPGTVIPLGRDVTAEPLRVSGDPGEGA